MLPWSHGRHPDAREIQLLGPPFQAFRVSWSRTQLQGVRSMNESFSALGVSAPVVRALSRRGIETPFAVQTLVLPDALGAVDVLAASPTGSGKPLAFGIPLVERIAPGGGKPSALVLVPTRELATQVVEELSPLAAAKSLRVAAVHGGAPVSMRAKRARGADVLVATP